MQSGMTAGKVSYSNALVVKLVNVAKFDLHISKQYFVGKVA